MTGAFRFCLLPERRNGDADKYEEMGYDGLEEGERMLLWHGSRTTNFGGR